MQDIRCKKCGKLLLKIDIEHAKEIMEAAQQYIHPIKEITATQIALELFNKASNIKCPRCGEMNTNKDKECQ